METTMLKKLIALATALTFVSLLASPGAEAASKQPVPLKTGTITSWDAATKRGVVKDDKGVEMSFVWNENTTCRNGEGRRARVRVVQGGPGRENDGDADQLRHETGDEKRDPHEAARVASC